MAYLDTIYGGGGGELYTLVCIIEKKFFSSSEKYIFSVKIVWSVLEYALDFNDCSVL